MENESNSFGMNDFYYYYRTNRKGIISKDMFRTILREFFSELVEYLYEGFLIKLPFGLGGYHIGKYKPAIGKDKNGNYYMKGRKAVDYKATKEMWLKHPELRSKIYIYYENLHTDGYKVKLYKGIMNKKILNALYNFKPANTFSRGLAKVMFKYPHREFLMED